MLQKWDFPRTNEILFKTKIFSTCFWHTFTLCTSAILTFNILFTLLSCEHQHFKHQSLTLIYLTVSFKNLLLFLETLTALPFSYTNSLSYSAFFHVCAMLRWNPLLLPICIGLTIICFIQFSILSWYCTVNVVIDVRLHSMVVVSRLLTIFSTSICPIFTERNI